MKTVGFAIIRQCYRFDGSAERIAVRTLSELNKYNLSLLVIACLWGYRTFVECNFALLLS
jgi:hypothetical protein